MTPASALHAARMSMGMTNEPVAVLTAPRRNGPISPPTLPDEFMNEKPAAASVLGRISPANPKNGPYMPHRPDTAIESVRSGGAIDVATEASSDNDDDDTGICCCCGGGIGGVKSLWF